jgi:hypothetical protein
MGRMYGIAVLYGLVLVGSRLCFGGLHKAWIEKADDPWIESGSDLCLRVAMTFLPGLRKASRASKPRIYRARFSVGSRFLVIFGPFRESLKSSFSGFIQFSAK